MDSPQDYPEADNEREAVYVSRYHDHHAEAVGDEEAGEWLIAETAYDVALMR